MKIRPPAILYFPAVLLLSCAASGTGGKTPQETLGETRWLLVLPDSLAAGPLRSSYLYFGADSTIRVPAACNTISGRYSTGAKGTLLFRNLAITWKACPDAKAEAAYLDMFRAVDRYEQEGTMLRLFRGRALQATFRKDKAADH